MNDLQLFIALGAVQIVMAGWGGILAVKSLPAGARKLPHVWGFIVLGVIGIAVTVEIGVSNDRSASEAKRTQAITNGKLDVANGKLDGAAQDTARMGGQLALVAKALPELQKRSPDPNTRLWADAVMRVIEESKTPSAQLIDQAKSDAKEFHRLATNWQGDEETLHMKLLQFPGRADEIRAKTNETDRKWSAQIKPLMTTANGVRQELLQRIPSKPTDEDAIVAATFAKSVVGQPISEVELEDASRYLDALAERASPR